MSLLVESGERCSSMIINIDKNNNNDDVEWRYQEWSFEIVSNGVYNFFNGDWRTYCLG